MKIVFGYKTLSRLHEGPLGLCIDPYLELLNEQGYSHESAEEQVRVLVGFSRWRDENGYKTENVSQEKADRFLKCRYLHLRPQRGDSAALHRLHALLCRMGVISLHAAPVTVTPCDKLLDDFRQYLAQERALCEKTQKTYLPYVRKFLCEKFEGVTIDFSQLCAQDVTRFVRLHAQDGSRSHAKNMTKALRSFLRYLHFRGDLAADLAACVPAVAGWSLSDIPKYLEPDQIQQVLDHCNLQTAMGLRDHAILLLLARLGLRAGEVAFLKMEDIDWETGQITVHGKGGSSDQLPLPVDVGKAIATYLQKGRPTCPSRYVFVRARAPRRGFAGASAIDSVVRCALARAGIDSQRKGAHKLRHSAAMELRASGVDLSTIALWLGHESVETTQIYLDADLALKNKALAKTRPSMAKQVDINHLTVYCLS